MNALRYFLTILATMLCFQASAAPDCEKMPAAYHEFVLFGKQKLYLSHLAEFHAIHAYQVIVEVSLYKDGVDVPKIFFSDRQKHPKRNYTVSPAKFGSPNDRRRDDWILPDYMKKQVTFNADIHWGTQNNEFLVRDVTVTIENVIYLRKFEESDQHSPNLEYIFFGEGDDHYFAHRIGSYPDFDQLIGVEVPQKTLKLPDTMTVIIGSPNNANNRLKNSDSGKDLAGMQFKAGAEIYFEQLTEQQ